VFLSLLLLLLLLYGLDVSKYIIQTAIINLVIRLRFHH